MPNMSRMKLGWKNKSWWDEYPLRALRVFRYLAVVKKIMPFKGELYLLGILLAEVGMALKRKPEHDVVYSRHRWLNLAEILDRKPYVREVNGFIADEMKIRGWSRHTVWVIDKMERWNIKRADRWIAVTEEIKDTLVRDYGADGGKVVVVPNGANVKIFNPDEIRYSEGTRGAIEVMQDNLACIIGIMASVVTTALHPTEERTYKLCFVGSLWTHQKIDRILDAIPDIDATLWIVGDGPAKEELKKIYQSPAYEGDALSLGWMTPTLTARTIRGADACLGPFFEGGYADRIGRSALKLCEYLACGKPVVCSRARDTEFVEKEGLGIVIDDLKPETISGAVNFLLERPELRKFMGGKARRWAVENASWDVVAGKIEGVMKEALK